MEELNCSDILCKFFFCFASMEKREE